MIAFITTYKLSCHSVTVTPLLYYIRARAYIYNKKPPQPNGHCPENKKNIFLKIFSSKNLHN